MHRLLRTKSLTALLVAVLLAAMLPLLLIYYTAHTINVKLLQEEVNSSLKRQNDDFADRLRDDLTRIITTHYILTRDSELGKLAAMPETFTRFEQLQAFLSIEDKIAIAQLNSRFIHDITVYIPAQEKCLHTNGTAYTLEEMRSITQQIDTLPHEQFFIHDGELILISENTYSNDSGGPDMVIRTTLSAWELLNFFRDAYWSSISNGTVMHLQSTQWPQKIKPDSREAFFFQQIRAQLTDAKDTIQDGELLLEHQGSTWKVLFSYIPYADLVLLRYYDVASINDSFGISSTLLMLFAAVAALAFLLIYYALYRLVKRPLNTLTQAFARVEAGNLNFELEAEARGDFAYVFQGFSHRLSRLKVLIQETYLQGQMVKKSEFKQLQAQIDPHFLYNGFFILNKRIRANDNEGALAFSKLLSDYFRYVTQNARDAVPLREEIAHAYNYAHIQQIRFSNRLRLMLEEPPEACMEWPIPRLILQPIVENVFRHVLDSAEDVTTLHITYAARENEMELRIEDNGSTLTEETLTRMRDALARTDDEKEISGLTNVHMRLRLFYGPAYGLIYEKSQLGGLLVRIRIPKKEGGAL